MFRSLNLTAAKRPQRRFQKHERLFLSHTVWAMVILLALVTFFVTIPVRFSQLVSVALDNRPYLLELGLSSNFLVAYLIFFDTTAMLTFCIIAGVIAWRKSEDRIALFVSAMLVLISVLTTRPVESLTAVVPAWRVPYVLVLALGISAVILFMFVFPDGRFVPRWSRGLLAAWLIWVFAWYLTPVVFVRPMPWPPQLQPGWAVLGWISCGLAVQIYRYFAVSTSTQKQQTKWVLLGLVTSALGFFTFLYLVPGLLPALQEPGLPHLYYILFGVPVLYLSLLLLPVAIGISILRFRLWDIGVLVNRTVVYGVLTMLLTAVYLAVVLLMQPFFRTFTNNDSLPTIAASTLATAVLFYPLRQRVQAFIDRRIFPRKYESVRILAHLNATLRGEVVLSSLTEHLERAVSELLEPTCVFTWLRATSSFRVYLYDETPNWEELTAWVNGELFLDDPLVAYFQQSPDDVVSLDGVNLASHALQQLKAAEITVLLLLRGQGELVGWLGVGPRTSQKGYSVDELNFLMDVAAVAGPAIRIAQLAQDQQAMALTQQRLAQELHLARLVQQTLLPHRWPDLSGWRIAAFYQPAQAIGGDFYDFFQFKDGRFGIVVGDVSDKGIPAALLMAATRSLLRSLAYQFVAPKAVLERANRLLLPDLPEGLFVTCLYALLDPATGRLLVANAGHNPPCHRSAAGVSEMWTTGMPLGWLPNVRYEEQELLLEEGDCILFYSDGLTEASNQSGEQLGISKLQALLTHTEATGSDLIDYLMQEVLTYSHPHGFDDDVTLVTLERSAEERTP